MQLTTIRSRRDGTFTIRWGVLDRELLAHVVGELRELVTSDDPSVTRLFPSAYGSDDERNAGWDVLARGELVASRLATLDVVDALIGRRHADADEIDALMRTVNDARLVLGSRLDVTEEGPPDEMTS